MQQREISRRAMLKGSAAAGLGGLGALTVAGPAAAFPVDGGAVLPWLDQPVPVPPPAQSVVGNLLEWESLGGQLTPAENFFTVKHYEIPTLDPATYRLRVEGLVDEPRSWSLAQLKELHDRAIEYTLECAGNTGLPFFIGGIGNAVWRGAPLGKVLRLAGPTDAASEVVFWGADSGQVTIRDDSGITSGGLTGTVEPDAGGGLDLTITEHFARSMTLDEAMASENLLCWEMNDVPLPPEHGFPLRLIAPGWYGVANVKWLYRIEVTDRPFRGRFMARDYVTIREQQRDGESVWAFSSVTLARLKSAPAKVVRSGGEHTVVGAAWGAPVARVEVQVDDGKWQEAQLEPQRWPERRGFAWRFWTYNWGRPSAGVHQVRSRAYDVEGALQPAPDDPAVANRRTYWEANGWIARRVRIG